MAADIPVFQTVDLAARFSACTVLGSGGELVTEWCSLDMSEAQVVDNILSTFVTHRPDVLVIEDIPHQMRFDTITKATARMQGRILDRVWYVAGQRGLDKVLFIPPSLWQRSWGKDSGLWRAKPEVYAQFAKDTYGYEPPDLLELCRHRYEDLHHKERQDERNALKKLMTDYVDSYLIAQWARRTWAERGTVDVKSSQRYTR